MLNQSGVVGVALGCGGKVAGLQAETENILSKRVAIQEIRIRIREYMISPSNIHILSHLFSIISNFLVQKA
jgi:hypothetical protein